MAAQLPYSSRKHIPAPISLINSFILSEIELHDIVSTVLSTPNNKATGLDGITVRLLKDNIDILGPVLCRLFNHSITHAQYPAPLKIAKVIPIHKDGDPADPANYRPISVLSICNNIFEKIISNQMKTFLVKYNVLCHQQHGFRSRFSTATAVITLSQKINMALHLNKLVGVVFLDLKKAFDTVDHCILLDKLKHCGFRGNFLSSYMEDRFQVVTINNITSSRQNIVTGVPQGSVLGTLFFPYI